MAESKQVLVTLKDGTKMTLKDDTELKTLSKDSIATVEFFADNEQADAGVIMADAGTEQSVTTVALTTVPTLPMNLPEKPPASMVEVLPLLAGAIAGAVSSMGMPALTNLVKNLLKDKLKLKGDSDKPAEEKPDEPTDCKTHQLKSNAKLVSLSSRVTALEQKAGNSRSDASVNMESVEELTEKIEQLEVLVSALSSKKKEEPAPVKVKKPAKTKKVKK